MSFIVIFLGSKSDLDIAEYTINILKKFEVDYRLIISSAHREPKRTIEEINKYKDASIFIGIAGMSAHLPGFIAAQTIKPVIGVPVEVGGLGGLDSLLSISQMPSGIPVATMSIGKPGAINAALFAIGILAINNKRIEKKIKKYREENRRTKEKVEIQNINLGG